ncbi:hypothetical protein INT48_009599 [Thamnidium elegans]|uniref:Uncharacterized protein n=1 Tax=Thamnidium elegans TaxID=101142 RepID=A0A8H7SHQ2_9FUNG|nr:hypothetical protein INT48_009599 [Thamnidium elegans]
MSLLLTKTCEYAILVSIQQELDLKLPPSIDDLIPTKTLISSPISKVDSNGTCSFNVSLVYFVSFKQLSRLRRNEATATLTIKSLDSDNSKLTLLVSEAKEVIPQSEHKLDHIYKFVSDKGAWCTIPKTRQQLKVGLFYVAMPDNHSSNNSIVLNTPCIQLRSPPPTPIMPKRLTATNNNRKKKISSILGTSNSVISCATSGTKKINDEKKEKKKSTDKPILRRAKSSLVDLNIEELADVLKKMKVFSSSNSTSTPLTPPPPLPTTQSYHQIGKGSLQYTFYFKIVYVDHFKQTLLRKTTAPNVKKINHLKKPYFSYSFLTHYNLSPVASINSSQQQGKYCFQFRGHINDIQNWLNAQSQIELSYIIMDKFTKESVGKSIVSLKSISKDKLSDKLYTVTDTNDEIISKLTVRSGIMTGWHKEEEYDIDDPWDIFHNKKIRHHSQSSVPTLLTSSTTCSTKSSSNHVPSISYIQRPSLKKSKYMTSTFFK